MELGHTVVVLPSLILIVVANGAPVVFARMLRGKALRRSD